MDEFDPPPTVPAWAEEARRAAVDPRRDGRRGPSTSSSQRLDSAGRDSTGWLDEPYHDLARNIAGHALTREASMRYQAGAADRSWRVGADGENLVADALAELTGPARRRWLSRGPAGAPAWRVLHNVRLGATAVADLDHVLIGPPGVIIINTKNLDPRYRISLRGGEVNHGTVRRDFVAKLDQEAARARSLIYTALSAVHTRIERGDVPAGLAPAVVELTRSWSRERRGARWPPLITALVFADGGAVEEHHSLPILARPATICRALRDRPTTLSRRQIDGLYELCRRSTTWIRRATPHA